MQKHPGLSKECDEPEIAYSDFKVGIHAMVKNSVNLMPEEGDVHVNNTT